MTHPDGGGWGRHTAHVAHPRWVDADATLRASVPLFDGPLPAVSPIIEAAPREVVEAVVAGDPSAREGSVTELTIRR